MIITHYKNMRIVVVVASLMYLSACATVVNPYVKPATDNFKTDPTLASAATYAIDTRELYYKGISEHGGFNRFVGTSLIGAAAAAIGLGIGDGNGSTITELGLGGAALYGLSKWLKLKPKMLVYQAGIDAINCTLTMYGPVRSVNTEQLDEHLNLLPGELVTLEAALRTAKLAIKKPAQIQQIAFNRGEIILRNGRTTLAKGREAKNITARAGVGLYDSTQNIRSQVTRGLINSEGNLTELLVSLSKTIPLNAGLITGKPLETPPETVSFSDINIDPLREAYEAVHSRTVAIEEIITGLSSGPSTDDVSTCTLINPIEAGFAFRTSPDSNVILDVSRADQPARIIISGGKINYSARWTSQMPADVELGVVDHDFGKENEAEVLLKVTKDSKPNTYELQITDSGRAAKTLIVSVVNNGSSNSSGTQASTGTSSQTIDPLVSTVQTLLIDARCLTPLKDNGESNADGISGKDTKEAITRYFTAMELTDQDIVDTFGDKNSPDLTKLINNLNDLRKKREAKAVTGGDISEYLCPLVSS